ncbi:Uncharacterised protein [[Clostridium] sordellii]|uniref:hypothetical protein n=1 Tax=Paraclostridium sordellii TaxID=1505 RepID=UPI0005DE1BA5|nr:hypothetical protein [Paeniclostridium sordellii]MCQ4696637.1 hypothetical protein [Paeniclostridium sordellii]MDU4414390.1 hypothetical protein [Paeniclostridium sordellii]MDU6482164.1 hypothetical protein [Paeniclostridium sordellii]MVO75932.1 hypothetical protein [Paeniclostridium sordellii]CEN83982.1 Uncharacterised protein [[Clostridium] sordellii] [Paeniclostridium sordellii]
MKKILITALIAISCIFSGCQSTSIEENKNIEVRGITPKISLITTAYDIYRINVLLPGVFNEELYEKPGKDSLDYYNWAGETYTSMNNDMKIKLRNIFKEYGDWTYIDKTIALDDDASVEEITSAINEGLSFDENMKSDVELFFNYFYNEYFKDLIHKNKSKINKSVKEANKFIEKNDIDIFLFMEKNSGIEFKKDYKALFYYDISPIGAMGFDIDNYKISTIQPNTDLKTLLQTPFHEYSHELFRSFTSSKEFSDINNELLKNEELAEGYDLLGKTAYDWTGWCEENLVNGFAEYLSYKFYGKKSNDSLYTYDLEFCNYLIEKDFNPEKTSLKDISIEFYKSKM